jgi:prepilin-type N-terminal cleavage/methylation domain-containing protein
MKNSSAREYGFTLIELLVVIAIISIIAGFLVPTLLRGRGEAYKVQCSNNLRQIFPAAMTYSDKKGTRKFPIALGVQDPPAHESLNELLSFDREGMTPALFVCPEGEAIEAQVDEDGAFVLDDMTLSYAWVARPTKNTEANKALSSDKYIQDYEDSDGVHSGHKKGMNVLYTDNRVAWVNEDELPEDTKLPKGLTR